MGKRKILMVENDNKITALLREYLEQAYFYVSILSSGDLVIFEVKENPPNLILLSLMLPGKDGLTVCREIRSFSRVPIIILTAKVDEIDRLIGFELGADDYICKPFSPREVVARIKAVLRRYYPEADEEQIFAGPIVMNPGIHRATIGDSDLYLTPIEFELLKTLISRPGYVFKRIDLVSMIQGYDHDGCDRGIDTHIKNIRAKIDKVLPGNHFIQTVYGIGYSFNDHLPHRLAA
jgi:two-component system response regulator BaeR